MLFFIIPLEPPQPYTDVCIQQVENIVEHEAGSTGSGVVFDFLAQQVIYDIPKYGCLGLTKWRWKIGAFDNNKVSQSVRNKVSNVINGIYWKRYPPCKFIGNLGDVRIWTAFGYRIRIDYQFNIKSFTVIGTNCK